MPSSADQLLVELAIKNHLITQAEGQACLAEVQPGQDLGELLVSKKLLKERHLKSLRKKLNKMMESRGNETQEHARPQPDVTLIQPPGATDATFVTGGLNAPLLTAGALVLFGQIAVKMNLVSQHDLERGLSLQEHLAAQGKPMRIGEIMVKAKRLTDEQVHKVLQFQDTWVFRCSICQRRFNVSGSQEAANALRCSSCGGQLSRSTTGISVAGTHAPPSSEHLAPLPSIANSLQSQGTSERRAPTAEDPAGILGLEWSPTPHTTFFVEKVLGRGGMGAVYVAKHRDVGREVALKVMLRSGGQASKDERERFDREAKLIAALRHPGIAMVYDAEMKDDLCWFSMELIHGSDFKATLRTGKYPMRKGAEVVAKVARAMDFAHQRGVIHRDLKPQNIMIDAEQDEPKVLDFGLAKNIGTTSAEQLTQMGAFLGTPAYMAPEQAGGDPNAIDHLADVYALGAILYEVLTGTPPFTGKKAIQVIRKVLKEDPRPCHEIFPQAPPDLEAIAMQALAKNPEDRQQSAGEFADQIEAVIGKVTRSFGNPPGGGPAKSEKKGFLGRFLGG